MKIFNINEVPLPQNRPVLALLLTQYCVLDGYRWVEVEWRREDYIVVSFDSEELAPTNTITHWMELPSGH